MADQMIKVVVDKEPEIQQETAANVGGEGGNVSAGRGEANMGGEGGNASAGRGEANVGGDGRNVNAGRGEGVRKRKGARVKRGPRVAAPRGGKIVKVVDVGGGMGAGEALTKWVEQNRQMLGMMNGLVAGIAGTAAYSPPMGYLQGEFVHQPDNRTFPIGTSVLSIVHPVVFGKFSILLATGIFCSMLTNFLLLLGFPHKSLILTWLLIILSLAGVVATGLGQLIALTVSSPMNYTHTPAYATYAVVLWFVFGVVAGVFGLLIVGRLIWPLLKARLRPAPTAE